MNKHKDSQERDQVISAARLTKKFGSSLAVDGISFAIQPGEVVGFVGANGAGKSTTINMLLGFISPSVGDIELFGRPLRAPSAHVSHREVGYGAGDMALPSSLSGSQYLRFVAAQSGAHDDERYQALVARFKPELNKKIASLSRGNKQKIALIAAFLPRPKLVVLDEPTSGLDPIMQEQFLDLVREEQASGTTIFMSSHYLNEVADVCSRVILMRHGKIVDDMPARELLSRGGKRVRVVTGYHATKPPRGAENVTTDTSQKSTLSIEFIWKKPPADLQQWIAGIKQLQDIEVTEFDLEGAFKDMYETEVKQ